ncbi:MAG: DNA alkylation repair protein [Anaerolineae bacterium]|nr:DNA alkylation repair protein [Anaerolineae bacterium]
MTTDVLQELEALGTEQNRKIYARHGVGENMYGVSYANLGMLRKRLRTNHELALELWKTGNHDARILALMIADPQQIDSATLDSWVHDLDNYVIVDAFSSFIGSSPLARQKAEQWIESDDEWTGDAGWSLIGQLALKDSSLPNTYFEPYLARIERDLHTSKNRVRHAMNGAVIAIGVRNDGLEAEAVAAAKRIGKVVVDHGKTDCKTPDAITYIAKTKARRAGKQKA